MFRTNLIPSLVNRCACIAVRTYRRSGNRKPRDLAGVRIHYEIFGDVDTLAEDPEQTLDADFNQLHRSHREHEQEVATKKEQLKYHVIKNKYFKDQRLPNFLTWAEKQQIRQLHKKEPSEWTAERLAESFPAVEEVIVKILKTNWTPSSMKRVQRHDENVRKNWELFKADKIKDLDADVREHLKKFSTRNFDSTQNAYAQIKDNPFEFKFPAPKNKEFLHIITSCKRNDEKPKQIGPAATEQIIKSNDNSVAIAKPDAMPLQLTKKQRSKTVNFNQLVKNNPIADTVNVEEMHLKVSLPEHDASLIKINSKPFEISAERQTDDEADEIVPVESSEDTETVDLALADANSTSQIIQKYPNKVGFAQSVTLPQIRHKIDIPGKLRKPGSIYKLYDCFYDDRGKFMYRVPGLVD